MSAIGRSGTLLGLLLCAAACRDAERPTAPSSVPTPPATIQPPPNADVPPLTGPVTHYEFRSPLSYPVSGYTTMSRYVLYENGAFALQYSSLSVQILGVYQHQAGHITFRFAGDHQWEATGTFNGDSLEVRYNLIMEHSDFENAIYSQVQ